MFDLDAEVLRWRERQERTSSLSAAELDEQHLGIGFWAWSLSFVCAAAALWLRDHDGASVRAKQSVSHE